MPTKYTKEVLQDAVDQSESFAGVLRALGLRQAGGTQSHVTSKIRAFGIDTSHFTGPRWNKGKTIPRLQRPAKDILVLLPEGSHRERRRLLLRAMLESGVEYKCECGLTDQWQGASIVLEIDHIDGNSLDNRLENLRFLCPNCHSQQATSKSWKYKAL